MSKPSYVQMPAPTTRGRVAWRWLPLAAITGAALSYAIHHAIPVDEHSASIALAVVASAAALTVGVGATTRPAERELPLVVSVRPEATQVVDFTNRELGFCAALHAHELGHGFFASLGHGFLRAYYATFVASPYAVALLATSQGAPVGLVVGAIDPRAHARWVLRRRGLRLAVRGAAVLVVRPRVAWRFLRTRVERYRARWRSERGGPEAATRREAPAVLTHVAVVPGAQGAGIGTALVESFVQRARAGGARAIVLVTHEGPGGAGAFYSGLGWTRDGSLATPDGPTMAAFRLELRA